MTTELLFKYFRGEASEKEKEEICLWLETSPSAEKEYRHAQFLFEGIVLYGDINLKKSRRKTPVIKAIKRVFAVAAVVSIVLAGGFILRNSIINIISRNYVAVRTLPGQKTTVELSDGTLVSLNSGTVLEYPPVFWGKRRTVKLSGEALFDVKPDIDRPFVVSTFASDILSPDSGLKAMITDKAGNEIASSKVMIRAGQMVSDTVKFVLCNLKSLAKLEEKFETEFDISIDNIVTEASNTRITGNEILRNMRVGVNKSALCNLVLGEPSESKLMLRDGWRITVEKGAENSGDNLVDGDYWTDVAKNYKGFYIIIDFGEPKIMSGVFTSSWPSWNGGGYYAPQSVEILVSDDNVKWKSLGEIATGKDMQYITFLSKPKARYLKYVILKMPYSRRVDITEFNVYEPE